MSKLTSLYLDFLRVIAAFGVLLVHIKGSVLSTKTFLPDSFGHKLVMIFFVLSGYLIAFTVDKKNKGSETYLVDRLSRLYSVALPALFLTYLLDFIGKHLAPDFYATLVTPDHQIIRFFLNATYLSQIWALCTKPSSNVPFWSISYEFWYYMLFWAYCYLNGKKRYIALVIICLLVGVKILLLFPVWLFGVIAYRCSVKSAISKKNAFLIFILTSVIITIFTFFWDFSLFADKFAFGYSPLFFSSFFAFDIVYGLFVAINIYSISVLQIPDVIPAFIEKAIRNCSSITFSLYLYHYPLLVFVAAIIPYDKSSYLQVIPLLIGIVLVVVALSKITEKQRGNFKALIEKTFLFFNKKALLTKFSQ